MTRKQRIRASRRASKVRHVMSAGTFTRDTVLSDVATYVEICARYDADVDINLVALAVEILPSANDLAARYAVPPVCTAYWTELDWRQWHAVRA